MRPLRLHDGIIKKLINLTKLKEASAGIYINKSV